MLEDRSWTRCEYLCVGDNKMGLLAFRVKFYTMKTRLMILSGVLSGIIACAPSADKEALQTLTAYTQFVDSIYQMNESWNTGIDTSFTEVPIDPNDPSKVRIDTIVTTPENRANNQFYSLFKETIHKEYDPMKASLDAKVDKMDEPMKKAYQQSVEKFESLKQP
jgi:hypothetical protein